MTPLTNTQGLSRIETVSIVGIACFAVVLLLALGSYMLSLMQQGNDANALNTAQGVAAVEAAGGCLVPGCSGGNDAARSASICNPTAPTSPTTPRVRTRSWPTRPPATTRATPSWSTARSSTSSAAP